MIYLLYFVSLGLIIYIGQSILRSKTFTVGDALAALGVVISIALAQGQTSLPATAAIPTVKAELAIATPTPTATPLPTNTPIPSTPTETQTSTPIVTPVPPTPTPTIDTLAQAVKLVEEGDLLYEKSDLEGAELKFGEALIVAPGYLPAYWQLTDVYLAMPQYWQQALDTAEAAAKLAPDDPTVLAYLAAAQMGTHRFEDARSTALRAVNLDSNNVTARVTLAQVLARIYELDVAYEHAQIAVRLNDNDAGAWITLGDIADILHKRDEAGSAYEKAIALQPEFFVWHLRLANHELDQTGNVDTARRLLTSGLNGQDSHPYTLQFKVQAAIATNDWKSAESACIEMTKYNQPQTPYPQGYLCMVDLKLSQNDLPGAEQFQKRAEEVAPAEFMALVDSSRIYLATKQGRCEESRQLAEKWLKKEPWNVSLLRLMGINYYLCDLKFDKAVNYFQQVQNKLPQSLNDATWLSTALVGADKPAEAIAVLDKIKSFGANDVDYYVARYLVYQELGRTQASLGQVQEAQNQMKEAQNAVQRWQELRPNDTGAMIARASIELWFQNIDLALRYAQQALDGGALGAEPYIILGQIYVFIGKLDEAEVNFEEAIERASENIEAQNGLMGTYLIKVQCDKAARLITRLQEKSDDQADIGYQEQLNNCQTRAQQPKLDDNAVQSAIPAKLESLGAKQVHVSIAQLNNQRALYVSYVIKLTPDSQEFLENERKITFELASILPQMVNPVEVLGASSSAEVCSLIINCSTKLAGFTMVATYYSRLWAAKVITDEQFLQSWRYEIQK